MNKYNEEENTCGYKWIAENIQNEEKSKTI